MDRFNPLRLLFLLAFIIQLTSSTLLPPGFTYKFRVAPSLNDYRPSFTKAGDNAFYTSSMITIESSQAAKVAKIDAKGNILWERELFDPIAHIMPVKVIMAQDGGAILLAEKDGDVKNMGHGTTHIAKYDSNGNYQWGKNYTNVYTPLGIFTYESQIYVVGIDYHDNGVIMLVDSDGRLVSTNELEDIKGKTALRDGVYMFNDVLAVTGDLTTEDSGKRCVLYFFTQGLIKKSYLVNMGPNDESCHYISQIPSGDLIIMGTSNKKGCEVVIKKFTESGELTWSKCYESEKVSQMNMLDKQATDKVRDKLDEEFWFNVLDKEELSDIYTKDISLFGKIPDTAPSFIQGLPYISDELMLTFYDKTLNRRRGPKRLLYYCSYGYYYSGGYCYTCSAGTYSNGYDVCYSCPSGNYCPYSGMSGYNCCGCGTYSGSGWSNCNYCGSGTYSSSCSSSCYSCNSGYYNPYSGACSCTSCNCGTYNPYGGQTSSGCCYTCGIGYYSGYGYGSCSQCPPGTWGSSSGACSCNNCPAGYYQPNYGQTSNVCQICAAGYYSYSGSGSCSQCPAGSWNPNQGAGSCTPCAAGQYLSLTGQITNLCVNCPVGTWSGSGYGTCTNCNPGYYQPEEGKSSCLACAAGTAQPNTKQTGCIDCLPGTWSGSAYANCAACPAGYKCPDAKMTTYTPCELGYYQGLTGQTVCIECPIGYYASSTARTVCTACPAGQYQDTTAQSTCKLCAAGTYTPSTGYSICTQCPVAMYQSSTGATGCNYCPSGTYTNSLGTVTCTPCAEGYWQDYSGQTACKPVPAGYYQNLQGKTSYISCPAGTYNNITAQAACFPCPVGTYTPSTTYQNCLNAPAGYYQDLTGQTGYKSCPAGTYQDVAGQTYCKPCEPGFYSTGSASVCTKCAVGYWQDLSGKSSCNACAAGTYQNAQGSTGCMNCLAGTYSPSAASSCTVCPAGSKCPTDNMGAPIPCEVGYYQSLTSQLACVQCATGTYRSSTGGSACSSCGGGTYANETGWAACKVCPVGTYADVAGLVDCKPCAKGYYMPYTGYTSCSACGYGTYADVTGLSACKLCASGTYQDYTAQSTCKPCSAATYQSGTGASGCIYCPAGKYADVTGLSVCKDCPLGTYSSSTGYSICSNAPAGYYVPYVGHTTYYACAAGNYTDVAGQSECKKCPVGKYQANAGYSYCNNAPVGYYQDLEGQTNYKGCPAGTYADVAGLSACKLCDPGYYSTGSASICTKCPTGTYQDQSGKNTCISCPLGMYQNVAGMTYCLDCLPGTYAPSIGTTTCPACPAGYKCPDGKMTAATPCEIGYYQSSAGKTDCIICPVGTYRSTTGGSACTNTSPGQYQDLTGAITFKNCAPGNYTDAYAQALCKQCPVGMYQNNGGYSGCYDCPTGTYAPVVGLAACLPCDAGSYQPYTKQTACILCPATTYQSATGATGCPCCPSGTYADVSGLPTCKLCPIGYIMSSTCANICAACSKGYYQSQEGKTACNYCVPGQYQDATGQSECKTCPAGTYTNANAAASCTNCAAGTYQDQPGKTSCISCTAGTYAPIGSSACSDCLAGTYSGSGAGTCISCPAGYKCPDDKMGAATPCEMGYYQDLTGKTACIECPAGKYRSSTGGSTCSPCATGSYQDLTASTACKSCPTGSYADVTGLSLCKPCEIGKYQSGTGAAACASCPAGTYADVTGLSACKPCAAGTYQDLTGQSACKPCPLGSYQDLTGKNTCLGCLAGYYQDETGQPACKPCPAGKVQSSTSQTACVNCATGKYQDLTGQMTCKACEAGKYQDVAGSSSCKDCDPGFYSAAGAVTCTSCSSGTYQDATGKTSCIQCPAGTYQPASGQIGCIDCLAGTYSYLGYANCVICPIGNYCPIDKSTGYTPCAAGYYQPDTGKTSCIECAIGYARGLTGGTACSACAAGYYQDTTASTSCKSCPAGSYTDQNAQSSCKQCELGKYQTNTATTACVACPIGYYADVLGLATCKACPAGSYINALGQSACTPCELGKYQPDTAKTACIACPIGSYQDETGKEICKQCLTGTYTNVVGQSSCTACTPGNYQDLTGQTGCKACPAGQYQDEYGQPSCKDCEPGYYSAAGASICTKCSAGTFQDLSGKTSCGSCPAGTYQPDLGQTVCLDCAAGTYSYAGWAACQPCPAGNKCPTSNTPQYIPCEIGYYQNEAGKDSCIECAVGYYRNQVGGTECTPCAVGYYQDTTASTSCKACPAGSYQDIPGQPSCKNCEVGKYQTGLGTTACIDCPAGYYADIEGLVNCKACEPGKYQNELGKTSCILCELGKYQPDSAKTTCIDCPVGYYQDEEGTTVCKPCAVGTIIAVGGQSKCIECVPGTYQDLTGKTTCNNCPPGQYQDLSGQTACIDCEPGYYSGTGAPLCTKCAVGYYQDLTGKSSCNQCPPGSYADIEGQPSCKNCEVGKYLNEYAKTSCINCPVGMYQPLEGKTACIPCEVGTYQPEEGKGSCIDCDPGFYQNEVQKTSCIPCAVGTFQANKRTTSCDLCPPGYYQDIEGQSKCTPCANGTYQANSGTTACIKCGLGWYQPNEAATTCLFCPIGKYANVTGKDECDIPYVNWYPSVNRDVQLVKGIFENMTYYNASNMSRDCYDSNLRLYKPYTLVCRDAYRPHCCNGSSRLNDTDCNYALDTLDLANTIHDNYCKICPFMNQTLCPPNGVCWDDATWTSNEVSIWPTNFTLECLANISSYCGPRLAANQYDWECEIFKNDCGAVIKEVAYGDSWSLLNLTLDKRLPAEIPPCDLILDMEYTKSLKTATITCRKANETTIEFNITSQYFIGIIKPTLYLKDACGMTLPQVGVKVSPPKGMLEIVQINATLDDKCMDLVVTSTIEKVYPEPIVNQEWEVTYEDPTGISTDILAALPNIAGVNKTSITIKENLLVSLKTISIRSIVTSPRLVRTSSNFLQLLVPPITSNRQFCGACQLVDRTQCFQFNDVCWKNYLNYTVTRPLNNTECIRNMAPVCYEYLKKDINDRQCRDFKTFYNLTAMEIIPSLVSGEYSATGKLITLKFSDPIRQALIFDCKEMFAESTLKWLPDPLKCKWVDKQTLAVDYNPEIGIIENLTTSSKGFYYDYEFAMKPAPEKTIALKTPELSVGISIKGLASVSECGSIELMAVLTNSTLYPLVFMWEITTNAKYDAATKTEAEALFDTFGTYSENRAITIPSKFLKKGTSFTITLKTKAANVNSRIIETQKNVEILGNVPKIKFTSKSSFVVELEGNKNSVLPVEVDTLKCATDNPNENATMNVEVGFTVYRADSSETFGNSTGTLESVLSENMTANYQKFKKIFVGVNKGYQYLKYYLVNANIKDLDTGITSSDSIIIFLKKPPIKAVIDQDGYTMSLAKDVTLTGQYSEIPAADVDLVRYLWKCKSAKSLQIGSCSCPLLSETQLAAQNLIINKLKLTNLCKYEFSLTLSASVGEYTRVASNQTEFLALEGPAETIKSKVIQGTSTTVKDAYLTFDVPNTNVPPENLKVKWNLVEVKSNNPKITEEYSEKNAFLYNFFNDQMKIPIDPSIISLDKPIPAQGSGRRRLEDLQPEYITEATSPVLGLDKASMVPEYSYTFAVEILGMDVPTFAFINFVMKPMPRPRVFTINPETGIGFETQFTFTFTLQQSTQVDSAQYQLFRKNCPGSDNAPSPISGKVAQTSSFTSTLAPGLKSCDYLVEIILRVYEFDDFIDVSANTTINEAAKPVAEVLSSQVSALESNSDMTFDQKMSVVASLTQVEVTEPSPESAKVTKTVFENIANVTKQDELLSQMDEKDQVELLKTNTEVLGDLIIGQQVNFDAPLAESSLNSVDDTLEKVKTKEGDTYVIPTALAALSGIADIGTTTQQETKFFEAMQGALAKMTDMKLGELLPGGPPYKLMSPSIELVVAKNHLGEYNQTKNYSTKGGSEISFPEGLADTLSEGMNTSSEAKRPTLGTSVFTTTFNPFVNIKNNTNISIGSLTPGSTQGFLNSTVKSIYADIRLGRLVGLVNTREQAMPLIQIKFNQMVKNKDGKEMPANTSLSVGQLPGNKTVTFTLPAPGNVSNLINDTLLLPLYYDNEEKIWSNENCTLDTPTENDTVLTMRCNHMGKKKITNLNEGFGVTVDVVKDVVKIIKAGNYQQLANVQALLEFSERTMVAYAVVAGVAIVLVSAMLTLRKMDDKDIYDIKMQTLFKRFSPKPQVVQTGALYSIMKFLSDLKKKGTKKVSGKSQKIIKPSPNENIPTERALMINDEAGPVRSVTHLEDKIEKAKDVTKLKKANGFSRLSPEDKEMLHDTYVMYKQCSMIYDANELQEIMMNMMEKDVILTRITQEYLDNLIFMEPVTFWTLVIYEHELLNAMGKPEITTPRPIKFLIFISVLVGELFTTGYFFDSSTDTNITNNTSAFLATSVLYSLAATVLMIPLKIFISVFMTGTAINPDMSREEIEKSEKSRPVFKTIGTVFGLTWVVGTLYGIFMFMVSFPNYAVNNWMMAFGMSAFYEIFIVSMLKVSTKCVIGYLLMKLCRTKFMMTAAGVFAGKVTDCIMKIF